MDDGILHIDSPVQRTFTLGDVFAIWGQPLRGNQVASATGLVVAYVNGERPSGDPSQIALQAHELPATGRSAPPPPLRLPTY